MSQFNLSGLRYEAEMAYTFTGLNKNFDHMDLDIDLLIFKINVQPLSCDFQKQNPFPFLNPDIYDIRNPA